jgi:hypothetical protein
MNDYENAVKLGLTNQARWEEGHPHNPKSIRLMNFLMEHDIKDYHDYFQWKIGGDGDNGEQMMFEMDAFFDLIDQVNKN